MNTRINTSGEIRGAVIGVNQVPPQARAVGMEILVNKMGSHMEK